MDTDHPFTGTHSPMVSVGVGGGPTGISQEGLALVPGKTYEGRIVLAADPGVIVTVRLVQDDGTAIEQAPTRPGTDYRAFPLTFTATAASDNARLSITGSGAGSFRVGAVSLMPSDNLRGWRADTVALLKQLNAPIYRWPGGNFVSGYNWRDGIGERDTRPPRQNPAWKGVEPNDVGIHEYMDLMQMIGAEPYVALNTGLGSVPDVADEVQYANGAADTAMGKLRAANGHPQPFGVRWWAVGNEMYGEWQLGHMPIQHYVKKHNAVVDAIRAVDPGSRVVGVGAVGPWDQAILAASADHLDLLSEHIYRKEMTDVAAHTLQLASDIDRVAQTHRAYRASIPALAGRDIRIAMDEWNYWYGPYVYGELGVQYHLKDALGVARALHAYFRNTDIYFMANYAQTVNVIGAIKTSRTAAVLDTTGLVLELYRNHFGAVPVAVSGDTRGLDVSAALTEDRTALTVAVVNPGGTAVRLPLDVAPVRPDGTVQRWTITGPDPMAGNVPGKAPTVVLQEQPPASAGQDLVAPPYSVSLYCFPLSPA
ncbi:MAG TPA: alpha-L-arabinofuranosidase C-terminal domain-containing protein [Spirochaetia bacterium]|nr:alpha-L-arabinofuranosidase C-terminal domain-containing protein [Spirochaetia bacterium]